MNPLKKVRPDWEKIGINHSSIEAMQQRPALALKIAQAIGISAELELWIGLMLAHLMRADYRAAIAMYNSVQSRAAQAGMVRAAADEALRTESDRDLLECILSTAVYPAFKERDKLVQPSGSFDSACGKEI